MNNKDVPGTVREILALQFGLTHEEIKGPSALEDLGADSLDRVEIVMALEEEFRLEITDEEGEQLRTVEQVISFVAGKLRAP
jgi:acyl carrier protein